MRRVIWRRAEVPISENKVIGLMLIEHKISTWHWNFHPAQAMSCKEGSQTQDQPQPTRARPRRFTPIVHNSGGLRILIDPRSQITNNVADNPSLEGEEVASTPGTLDITGGAGGPPGATVASFAENGNDLADSSSGSSLPTPPEGTPIGSPREFTTRSISQTNDFQSISDSLLGPSTEGTSEEEDVMDWMGTNQDVHNALGPREALIEYLRDPLPVSFPRHVHWYINYA